MKRRSALKALEEVEQFLTRMANKYSDEDIERILEMVRAEISGEPQFSARVGIVTGAFGELKEIRSDDPSLKIMVISSSTISEGRSEKMEFQDGTSYKTLKKSSFKAV